MPRHDNRAYFDAVASLMAGAMPDSGLEVTANSMCASVLTACFNAGWVRAVNMYRAGLLDAFAMLHADVHAEDGWLDKLHAEMLAAGADMVGAVVGIKDSRGLTSTAVDDTGSPWRVRRLTCREVLALPPTFTTADLPGRLLLNTGCWLIRLGPWCGAGVPAEQVPCFRQLDRLEWDGGKLVHRCVTEDWDWSYQLHNLGLKLAATRKVKTRHFGEQWWSNQIPYGSWDTDEDNGVHPEAVAAREARKNGKADPALAALARA